jgi:23S rRNA pseudouridine1911/1915/1917 synthase
MTRTLTVDARAAAERLDVYLAAALGLTRSQAQRLLRAHAVRVNGQAERPSYLVQTGDELIIQELAKPSTPPSLPELPIVYEDDDIMVIDKPAGIAAHPGSGLTRAATVADFARQHTTDPDPERPGIVHRLDRDTSGLMILAKNPEAKAFLQEQFRNHTIRKTYTLLAVGHVKPLTAVIRLPQGRDPTNPLRRAIVTGGKEAVTRYHTIGDYPGYSLIEAWPETGRTHQLRVHFAAIGHPVAGDITYGSTKRPLGLKRQFLHATAISFTTPSGRALTLTSSLPPDLANCMQTLERQV